MEEILNVTNLCKRYTKNSAYAVENLSFSCHAGEIVGLLGHNGAGKSTTLKCLEGMYPFEEGKVSVCGFDLKKQPLAAKARLGFVTDDHAVFLRMTGEQYLSFLADVYRVPTAARRERYRELEGVFRLGEAIARPIFTYSHGMKQKVCMMGSLIHRPRLWILDEPMTGLDPLAGRAVRGYMRAYADAGNAILFSSHALDTVAKLCDRAILLKKGKMEEIDLTRPVDLEEAFDEA